MSRKRRTMTWLIGCVTVALLLAACSSSSTVEVGPADDGTTIDLSEGDTLQVQLEGNPTTGFNWQVADTIDTSVLEQEGEPSFDANDDKFGSPGVVTLMFKAVGAGTTPLDLEYKAVSGDAVAERTFSLTVNVG